MTTQDAEPRVFFLGGRHGQEIPREHWESRRQDYDDPRYRELAVEVAPGVHVTALGHGDFILPGQSVGSGVQIAVWTAPPEPSANCEACWHLWSLHGPDGCSVKSWTHSALGPPPCPCEHTPPETQGVTSRM